MQDGKDKEKVQYAYNDYAGYFENLDSDIPLRIPDNVKLFKSLHSMIDEYYEITVQQDLEQMKKDELILEMASTLEQIYINSQQTHLIETIASSLCLILNKKDKITSPSHIYAVLEKKYKNRYASDFGRSRKTDIFSRRNVMFNDFRDHLIAVISFLDDDLPNVDLDRIDIEKQREVTTLLNRFDESKVRASDILNGIFLYDSSTDNATGSSLPQEREKTNGGNINTTMNDYNNGNGHATTTSNLQPLDNNSPRPFVSKYYLALDKYISILTKLKDNVLKYPPSTELDDKLEKSLSLEIEMLMPSIDMKFKRSIPQLDETIQYADNQSLNGASSVMHEKALVKDFRGTVIDPNDTFNRFLEITHKLTPEQIDTRRPYISIIRKKMQRYQPHLYYHLLWYEGCRELGHRLSMGKFARSNLLKKKMVS